MTDSSALSRRSLFRLGGAVGLTGTVAAGLGAPFQAVAEPSETRIDYLDLEPVTSTARTSDDGARTVAEFAAQTTSPFSTLAVTWTATDGPAPDVRYRSRRDGKWSDWAPLGDGALGRTEGNLGPRDGTDPIFVGDSDGVAVEVLSQPDAEVEAPQVVLIDPERLASDTEVPDARLDSTAAAAARPDLTWRGGWGGAPNSTCRGPNPTLQAAIIHHTAGTNSYTQADSAQIIRGILAYHTNTLGWCDIGYNFLIDKWGRIFEGRDGSVESNAHGAHAGSWNTDTVGISFMGNYETAAATSAMMESAARVAAWKLAPYGRNPQSKVTLAGKSIYRIAGHGDVMATACPGKNVISKMSSLRSRTAALIG